MRVLQRTRRAAADKLVTSHVSWYIMYVFTTWHEADQLLYLQKSVSPHEESAEYLEQCASKQCCYKITLQSCLLIHLQHVHLLSCSREKRVTHERHREYPEMDACNSLLWVALSLHDVWASMVGILPLNTGVPFTSHLFKLQQTKHSY